MSGAHLAGRIVDAALGAAERIAPSLTFRFKRQFFRPDMAVSLEAIRRNGFSPSLVIDVGAFEGEWALLCGSIFPRARVLMIEPGPTRAPRLRALVSRHPGLSFEPVLLAAEPSTLLFREDGSNSGIVAEGGPTAATMPGVPLDVLVAGTAFARPNLIKVDVQGYELDVLRGARETLTAAEVVILEVSLIRLHERAPSVLDVLQDLEARGFRLLDVCSLIRRPVDHALWQLDAMFVRDGSTLGHRSLGWSGT